MELTEEETKCVEQIENENQELLEYIGEMVQLISTGKDEVDQQNIELIAGNIHAKALQMHKEYVAVTQASL